MAEFPTYEQMAKNVADKALDEYLINGKTLREWITIIVEQDIRDNQVKDELNRVENEQKPCEDCISRAELLKAIDTWDKFGCDSDTKLVPYKDHYIPYIHYDDVIKCIKGMPSVQLKTGEDIHIKAIKNNLNRMVDKLVDDTDYYDCIYHLEQLEKEQKIYVTYNNDRKMEQEPILDKIRTEIVEKVNILDCTKVSDVALKTAYIEVLKIIDKYRGIPWQIQDCLDDNGEYTVLLISETKDIAHNGTPIDQEPKGHWIKAQPRGCWSYSDVYAECDCCHGEPTFNGWNMKYCPNCGSRMSEVSE